MPNSALVLEVDLTGKAAANLILGEQHSIGTGVNRLIAPKHGAFYKEGLVVKDGSSFLPIDDSKYLLLDFDSKASMLTGKEVYGSIVVTDASVFADVAIDYQAFGGEFSRNRSALTALLATRMTMDEMRPILPEMDKINYFSVECWGGATFDSCIRFLDEDPWERLRILRKELPHQKLQMLFRGQNMLGYRPYADDAVEYFVKKSVANGIDVIRIFDALNDPRNLQTAIKSANKEGAHVQGCISYTLSPVHNNEYFAAYAKTLEEMGANSICIKDMAGLLTPYTCYDLVKKLKETVSIPVDIHSHYTAGLASMSILKGIEAGADIIDTAMSPLSLGTSHMPTESLVAALQGTDYDTGLDLKQLNVVRAYFAKLREKYIANGQISPKSLGVDANTLLYQVPGGMFSNMLKQLKDAGKEDKLDEVLAEIPRVREDAGYPPLVTPTSQIVGTQAVFNVILGERYKMVTKEFKGLVHGDYGKTPAPIKPEFTKKILGDEQPITCRFADTLAPEMDKLKAEAAK